MPGYLYQGKAECGGAEQLAQVVAVVQLCTDFLIRHSFTCHEQLQQRRLYSLGFQLIYLNAFILQLIQLINLNYLTLSPLLYKQLILRVDEFYQSLLT